MKHSLIPRSHLVMAMTPLDEAQPPLAAVGFFHFGKGYSAPLAALDAELERVSATESAGDSLSNALIVLPEAFNLGRQYYHHEPPSIDSSFRNDLSKRSLLYGCAFVAGLIVDDSPGVVPPYSSAYLVDGEEIILLSRKASKDNTEATSATLGQHAANYTAFPGFYSHVIRHRQVAIAALVCLDGQYEQGSARSVYASELEQLAKSFGSSSCAHKLLCIPARVGNGFCNGQPGQDVAFNTPWSGIILALANGLPAHVASFVTNSNGIVQQPVGPRFDNRIELFRLTDLTSQTS
jgi:hypothetical protein